MELTIEDKDAVLSYSNIEYSFDYISYAYNSNFRVKGLIDIIILNQSPPNISPVDWEDKCTVKPQII